MNLRIFRHARSLTGTQSSVTNFSEKQFMKKAEKISILNNFKRQEEIKERHDYFIKLPIRHKQKHLKIKSYMTIDDNNDSSNRLTTKDVEEIVQNAYNNATTFIDRLKMTELLKQNNVYNFNELSIYVYKRLSQSLKTVDYSKLKNDDNNDNSSGSNSDNNCKTVLIVVVIMKI
ncbi:unnamed protein product [Didymodactylos carnosus]|uniref:Uncharacterized protein n=1 Tax=Didymodactylos carnosus TaxID=1234261 RepID=A0A814QY63_9BILA|nr:unnamed protein product [Didymodactylos carnosus]CAF3889430.1 unnamed protein product [Didymodactylos carnosus]